MRAHGNACDIEGPLRAARFAMAIPKQQPAQRAVNAPQPSFDLAREARCYQ